MPSNFIAILLVLGTALTLARFRRAGGAVGTLALAALFFFGLGPGANLLIAPLEDRFPRPELAEPPAGIVVLGGGVADRVSALRGGGLELNEAGDRVLAMAALARAYPDARIIYSGGTGALTARSEVPEADLVGAALQALGINPARVVLENRSRNTEQNAAFSRALAEPRPGETWLLVTSAFHMPRSIGVFRAAGFPVVAYPVDYRTGGGADVWRPFGRVAEGLQRTDIAVREWFGLIAYRLTGRTDRLLPSPDPPPIWPGTSATLAR